MSDFRAVEGHSDLKQDVETGIIYVRKFKVSKKKELFKSTRTDNLRKARKIADNFLANYLGTRARTFSREITADIWPKWLATKDNKSQATLYSISNSWRRLEPCFGIKYPHEITSLVWENYLAKMKESNPDQKFFNDRKWLKMFLIWLHENNFIEKVPKLRNPDPIRSEAGRYVTYEEFKKLLECANPELQLQMLMGYTMGMRISEIMCLTWGADKIKTSYVDLESKVIALHALDTKMRRARTFAISNIVYPELVLRRKESASEYVWPSLGTPLTRMDRGGHKTAWRLCRERAGIHCRTHDLRHTFLTNAFKEAAGKIDSLLVCDYAGVSIEEAQDKYLHFTHEDTRAVSSLVQV